MSKRFYQIINSSKLVLVDFYADWCVPCRQMNPVLKEVKEHYRDNVRILKVNVDHHPEIADSCNVNNIPAVLVFQKGQIQWTGVGVQQVKELSIVLNQLL